MIVNITIIISIFGILLNYLGCTFWLNFDMNIKRLSYKIKNFLLMSYTWAKFCCTLWQFLRQSSLYKNCSYSGAMLKSGRVKSVGTGLQLNRLQPGTRTGLILKLFYTKQTGYLLCIVINCIYSESISDHYSFDYIFEN